MVRDAYAFGKPVELMGIPNITILFLNMTPTFPGSTIAQAILLEGVNEVNVK
jgi:hypothetical protein